MFWFCLWRTKYETIPWPHPLILYGGMLAITRACRRLWASSYHKFGATTQDCYMEPQSLETHKLAQLVGS
ncbi:hypothetical protein CapIbe_007165 [Capra ibex]